jgi:hypothetical protein
VRRFRIIVTLMALTLGGAAGAQELCDLSDQLMLDPDDSQALRAAAFGDGLVFLLAPGVLTVVDESTLAVRSSMDLPTADLPRSAVWREGLLYATTAGGQLWTIDASDPDEPVVVSEIDVHDGQLLSAAAGLVVVGDGDLTTIDVSDPARPVVSGWADAPGTNQTTQAAVNGNAVYVASSGLQIFDISDFANPYLRQNFLALSDDGTMSYPVRSVSVVGDRAFIGIWALAELWSLDVSRPFVPVRTAVTDAGRNLWRSVALPGILFAGDGGAVTAYSTADPDNLSFLHEIPDITSTRFWAGGTLFVGRTSSAGTVAYGIDRCDGPCPADLAEPFGELNFFDVSRFLAMFAAQDDAADFAEPFGQWDFFDVSAYLSAFNAGCPE